jgi:release factor glutamine methyltransferase
VARTNAGLLGVEVNFAHGDLLAGLDGEWDAILANLPYVAMDERSALPRDVIDHEPPEALFAGHGGLEVIARLVEAARTRASLLALEVGAGQAPEVSRLMSEAGFASVMERHDLSGIARVVVGRR